MVETQTKINMATIALVLVALGLTQADFDFENKQYYYCEDRPELIYACDGFNKYVSLFGKCLNATFPGAPEVNLGNKICRPGWQEIQPDISIPSNVSDAEIPVFMMEVIINGSVQEVVVLDDSDSKMFTADVGGKCLQFPRNKPINVKDLIKVKEQGGAC